MKSLVETFDWLFALLAAVFVTCTGMAIYQSNWAYILIPFVLVVFYAGWLDGNFIFFALIASLPFSFEFHLSNSLGTDVPDEGLMVMASYIFLAAWIFSYSSISPFGFRHPLVQLLAIMICWTIACSIYSQHPIISLKYLLAKGWYIGAFLGAAIMVFHTRRNISIMALILLSGMTIVVAISLFRHAFFGFRFADINRALSPFFRNHVNYGAMLVCTIPVAVAAHVLSPKKYKKLLAVVLGLLLVALFFSYSRGAWLALIMGSFAAWLIIKRKLLLAYILVFILSSISLLWISNQQRYMAYAPDFKTTIFHKDFREHWVATYKLKDVSTAERFYRWTAAVRMIKDKWIVGYGPNSFYDEYKPYAVPAFKTWVSNNPDHSTVHNYFLLTAVEQGLPGLLILLLLFGAMIYYAEKIYKRSADKAVKTIALTTGVIISMLLVLNSVSDLVETDKIGSMFFLSIAVLVSLDRRSDLSSHV